MKITDEEWKEYFEKQQIFFTKAEVNRYIKFTCQKNYLQSTQFLVIDFATKIYALFCSIKYNFFEFIDYLLVEEFYPLQKYKKRTILDYAIYLRNEDAFEYISKHNLMQKYIQKGGKGEKLFLNSFFYAISLNQFSIVKFITEKENFDINIKNTREENALFICAKENKIEIGRYFVQRGIDVNYTTKEFQNVFHYALYYSNFDFAKFLVKETNVNINLLTKTKRNTPLMTSILSHRVLFNNNELTEEEKEKISNFAIYLMNSKNYIDSWFINLSEDSLIDLTIKYHINSLSKYLIDNNHNIIMNNHNSLLIKSINSYNFETARYLIELEGFNPQLQLQPNLIFSNVL